MELSAVISSSHAHRNFKSAALENNNNFFKKAKKKKQQNNGFVFPLPQFNTPPPSNSQTEISAILICVKKP